MPRLSLPAYSAKLFVQVAKMNMCRFAGLTGPLGSVVVFVSYLRRIACLLCIYTTSIL